MSKSCQHPEAREGEVFLSNSSDKRLRFSIHEREEDLRTGFECIGHPSKRKGQTAFNVFGETIPGMYPIFISKADAARVGYKHVCDGACGVKPCAD